jgi:FKBP-type peptidyl-prolyl cis-trans isomerase
MQKSFAIGCQLLAAGMMWLGQAPAQQTPAASAPASSQSSSGQSASGTTGTTAKKPAATAAKKPAAAPLVLKTDKQKQSYAEGMSFGMGLHNAGMTLDTAIFLRGMRDAMTGGKTVLSETEARAAAQQFQTEFRQSMQVKAEARAQEESAPNRKEGEAFLAANKTKDGVVSLPSGLQYKILTAGNGPKPAAGDTVSCNYRGTLLNGKEFDNSAKHGGPASFQVGRVIKGWTEALQLMPVGSKWQLFIPADLAYGDQPPPGADIAPGDTLIFEVELLSIGEQKKQ